MAVCNRGDDWEFLLVFLFGIWSKTPLKIRNKREFLAGFRRNHRDRYVLNCHHIVGWFVVLSSPTRLIA